MNLELGRCKKCSNELRYGFCYKCLDDDWSLDNDFDECLAPKTDLDKIREYLFNTGVWNKELPDYNISEEYMKQTLEFLNTLENDHR